MSEKGDGPGADRGHQSIQARSAASVAERGWVTFPLVRSGKPPVIKDWERRAQPDQASPPGCNTGVACGPSRLVVIDLDVKPDGDGADVFARLLADHDERWPATYTVRTPTGGLHLYFAAPPARAGWKPIGNSVGELGPRIDVRAAGGCVVAPGSVINGRVYQELDPNAEVWPLPEWLRLRLSTPPRARREPVLRVGNSTTYVRAGLRNEMQAVADAPEGTRNVQLNRSAYAIGRLVADGRLRRDVAIRALAEAAIHAGLDESEATKTIESAFRGRSVS
jgi:hypothetical protein